MEDDFAFAMIDMVASLGHMIELYEPVERLTGFYALRRKGRTGRTRCVLWLLQADSSVSTDAGVFWGSVSFAGNRAMQSMLSWHGHANI